MPIPVSIKGKRYNKNRMRHQENQRVGKEGHLVERPCEEINGCRIHGLQWVEHNVVICISGAKYERCIQAVYNSAGILNYT